MNVLTATTLLFAFLADAEIIVRDGNQFEGSVCFTKDGKHGVCRESCAGEGGPEPKTEACNPGKQPVLHCCKAKDSSKTYPRLEAVCAGRRITEEFYVENRKETAELNEVMKKFKDEYMATAVIVKEACRMEAEEKAPGDFEHYTKNCEKLAQDFPLALTASPLFRNIAFPHIVGIGSKMSNGSLTWLCGGALIHKLFVLTSSNCILNSEKRPDIVRVGYFPINSDSFPPFVSNFEYEVRGIHTSETPYSDLTMLRVSINKDYVSEDIQEAPEPICLWTSLNPPKEDLLVLGYYGEGSNHTNGDFFEGNATLLELENCQKHPVLQRKLSSNAFNSQICAHDSIGDMNACQGGSGASLQYTEAGPLKVPFLVGMASLGGSCTNNEVSMYTSIYPYLDWIEHVIDSEERQIFSADEAIVKMLD